VAVATGHGERVTPDAEDFGELFVVLAAEGCTVVPVSGSLAAGIPEPCGALLIGAPMSPLAADEIAAVRAWVAAGGALLVAPGAPPTDDAFATDAPAAVDASTGAPVVTPGAPSDDATVSAEVADLVPELAFGARLYHDDLEVFDDEYLSDVAGRELQPREVAAITWSLQSGSGGRVKGATVAARVAIGRGHAVVLFGADLMTTRVLRSDDDYGSWTNELVRRWLALFPEELARRLRGPQRHRLLQAYPMAPAMAGKSFTAPFRLQRPSAERAAVVGVLPHPYCNPAVKGCGFCTFPHEPYAKDRAETVGLHVAQEIAAFRTRLVTHRHKEPWPRRRVESLYLGGGTANLTPPDTLRAIGEALHEAFVLDDTEVTFEGVPIYFIAKKPSPLDLLREIFPSSRPRVSLGIQTFLPAQLERMGRRAFGDAADFARVTAEARARGFVTSADMLFDLPGQTRDEILADARAAADLGLDQVCFYHLVMFDGLETEWSRDRSLLAQLPDNAHAADNWLALREELLRLGYVQTSLTDFERKDALEDPARRFRYEPCVFTPERYDQLGFGPAAVTFWGHGNRVSWKQLNPTGAEAYLAANPAHPWERDFAYGDRDWAVLYLTRKIASLTIDRAAYVTHHGRDPLVDFGEAFATLSDAGLVAISPERIDVTPLGMFYADAIAGLLAWRRMQTFKHQDRRVGGVSLRDRDLENEAMRSWMG
jgi:oxygen-independent coproporphyrinogen-3 oxidase